MQTSGVEANDKHQTPMSCNSTLYLIKMASSTVYNHTAMSTLMRESANNS